MRRWAAVRAVLGDWEGASLAKHSATLQAASVAAIGLAFVQSIVVTRSLGAHTFGLLALVFAFVGIVNQFIDFRAWELTSNHVAAYAANGESAKAKATLKFGSMVTLVSGVLATALCIAGSHLISTKLWHQPKAAEFIVVFALASSWSGQVQNLYAFLRVEEAYRQLAYIKVGIALAGVLATSAVAAFHGGLREMVWAYSGVSLATSSGATILLIQRARRTLGSKSANRDGASLKSERRGLIAYLSNTWLSGSLMIAAGQLDEVILGSAVSPSVVGGYRVAKNLGKLGVTLSDPVYEVTYPQLARLWAIGARKTISQLVQLIVVAGGALALVAVSAGMVWGHQAITFVYGKEYALSGGIVAVFMLYALYIPFLWCGPLFRVSGNIRAGVGVELVATTTAVILMLALVPRYGALGASLGFVSRVLIYCVLAGVYFYRRRAHFFGT